MPSSVAIPHLKESLLKFNDSKVGERHIPFLQSYSKSQLLELAVVPKYLVPTIDICNIFKKNSNIGRFKGVSSTEKLTIIHLSQT